MWMAWELSAAHTGRFWPTYDNNFETNEKESQGQFIMGQGKNGI